MTQTFPSICLTLILSLSIINPCISFYHNHKHCPTKSSSTISPHSNVIFQKSQKLNSSPSAINFNAVLSNYNCGLISEIHNYRINHFDCSKSRKLSSLNSYNNNYDGEYRRRRYQKRKKRNLLKLIQETPRNIFFPKNMDKWYNIQIILTYALTIMYVYQILSAVQFLPQLKQIILESGTPRQIPSNIKDIIKQTLLGTKSFIFSPPSTSSSIISSIKDTRLKTVLSRYNRCPTLVSTMGPLSMDYIYQSYISKFQIHRYFTYGLIHNSIFHLLFNLYSLSKIPAWLSIIDWNFYATTFICSTIGGSITHSYQSSTSFVLGASSGICGLYGAMFILYRKMKRDSKSNGLMKQMLAMIFVGCLSKRISNASNIGGFLTGCIMALLFGSNFRKSYVMKKKVWFVDDVNEYVRRVIGPDLALAPPFLSLRYFWVAVLLLVVSNDSGKNAMIMMGRGLLHPGCLSGTA